MPSQAPPAPNTGAVTLFTGTNLTHTAFDIPNGTKYYLGPVLDMRPFSLFYMHFVWRTTDGNNPIFQFQESQNGIGFYVQTVDETINVGARPRAWNYAYGIGAKGAAYSVTNTAVDGTAETYATLLAKKVRDQPLPPFCRLAFYWADVTNQTFDVSAYGYK